uniref:Condensation domain-containing protein n=1 Tax=Eutreptiella gymnastica TaxID=73025 RepID=A0A7S1IMB4_9EUGL
MAEEEAILLQVPPGALKELHALTNRDLHAHENYAPIKIAYRFNDFVTPSSLLKSWHAVLEVHPAFGGHVINTVNGKRIECGTIPLQLRVVRVAPATFKNPLDWVALAVKYCSKRDALFQPMLLTTGRPSDGCVLVCVFDHTLGDAATFGIFMKAWSDAYSAVPFPHDWIDLPSGVSRITPVPKTAQDGVLVKRFHFQRARHALPPPSITGVIHQGVSTNDRLMAQAACALARIHRDHTAPTARIALMVDPRGRGLPESYIGNAATSVSLHIPWEMLLTGQHMDVAQHLRKELIARLKELSQSPMSDAPPPTCNAFMWWNSWDTPAGGQAMAEASFGTAMPIPQFEWLNAWQTAVPRIFILVPTTVKGSFYIQVALEAAIMQVLEQTWQRCMIEDMQI